VKFKRKGCLLKQAEKGYADERETYWGVESKEIFYEEVEGFAREKIREHLQDLLEQEVSEWLGAREERA